jgi:hypothetical protein
MRDNIDLEYFKNRLEERLKDITDAKRGSAPWSWTSRAWAACLAWMPCSSRP